MLDSKKKEMDAQRSLQKIIELQRFTVSQGKALKNLEECLIKDQYGLEVVELDWHLFQFTYDLLDTYPDWSSLPPNFEQLGTQPFDDLRPDPTTLRVTADVMYFKLPDHAGRTVLKIRGQNEVVLFSITKTEVQIGLVSLSTQAILWHRCEVCFQINSPLAAILVFGQDRVIKLDNGTYVAKAQLSAADQMLYRWLEKLVEAGKNPDPTAVASQKMEVPDALVLTSLFGLGYGGISTYAGDGTHKGALTTVASIATGIVKGVKMVIESGAKETVTIVKKEVTKVGNVAAKTATTVVDVLKQVGGISQAGAEAAASALEASLKYFRGTGKGTTEAEALKLVHCISLNRGGQVCAQSLASNAATAWFAADWSKLLPWLYVGGTAGTLGGVGYYVYSSSEKIGQTIGDAVQSVSAGIQAAAIAGLGVSVLLTMSTPAKTPKQRSERNYTVSSQFGLLVGAGVAVAVLASRKRQREEEEEK